MFQKLLRNPLVNVACWHIQCKDCWFETLVSSFLGQVISKYLEVYSYVSFTSFSGHEEVLQRMWCIDYSWGLEKSLSVIFEYKKIFLVKVQQDHFCKIRQKC